jgi:quinol monooxygenase YgiN
MMLLQAAMDVPDYERFKAAVEWLVAGLEHPKGFLRLEVLRSADEPNRVMFSEWWESREAFETAFAQYDQEQRAEFLARAGFDPATLSPQLWVKSDIPVVGAESASGMTPG